jgi:hypothetical protein
MRIEVLQYFHIYLPVPLIPYGVEVVFYFDHFTDGTSDQLVTRPLPKHNKTNLMALVRKRAILTERPPLVGKVSANFSG